MTTSRFTDHLRALLFHAFPHHFVSRLIFWLTRRETQLKDPIARWFIKYFGVDMDEALEPRPERYPCFNAFFVRELKPGVREIAAGKGEFACPADGAISQLGDIDGGRIVQAKNQSFTVAELLGGAEEAAAQFNGGKFCTIYLSPRDYHRVHMPLDGKLTDMAHVPGRLFTVAPFATASIPRLFARNERVVALFETGWGPMALALVGAVNVAAIETVWAGLVTPPRGKRINQVRYDPPVELGKGEEMGRFNMGSTVIVLLGSGHAAWESGLGPESPVRLGQRLATNSLKPDPN